MKYIALILIFSCNLTFSQNKDILFTIDNTPFYSDEFLRVYNKNLDLVKDDSQKNIDNYLELYLAYKLKVVKANKMGLQNETAFQNELKSHRTQLSKNYLNDSKVTEELVKEAYYRTKNEIKASHILVLIDENASPEDTLKAYKKITDLKNKIASGEDFEQVAAKYSEDPSAKDNNGNLGYFGAFRMVYAFENQAYKTKIGSVSKPFRTRFGYHIVKTTAIRESQGEITVAHIMIAKTDTKDPILDAKGKQTIQDLYQKIKQGENFEALAQQFSEDKSTALKGGVLQRFAAGQLSSEVFEKTAFSLQQKGEISTPIETQFGWHIVKLIENHPVKEYENLKAELEEKVKKDDRSLLITNSLAKKLRDKYTLQKTESTIALLKKGVTPDFYEQKWEIPANLKNDNPVYTIDNKKKISSENFANYVYSQQKSKNKTKPTSKLISDLVEKHIDQELVQYYTENLETEFQDFKFIMEEYRDGLLLFDLMEKEIWTKSKTDSIGIKKYYETNSKNYQWKKRYDVAIFSSTDKKIIENARKLLKKGKSIDQIKDTFNKDGKINIMVKSGLFEDDFDILMEYKNPEIGITDMVSKGNYHFVVDVKGVRPSETKELEACRGKVIGDYQTYLENNWVSELKKEFSINLNRENFEKIKAQIKK